MGNPKHRHHLNTPPHGFWIMESWFQLTHHSPASPKTLIVTGQEVDVAGIPGEDIVTSPP